MLIPILYSLIFINILIYMLVSVLCKKGAVTVYHCTSPEWKRKQVTSCAKETYNLRPKVCKHRDNKDIFLSTVSHYYMFYRDCKRHVPIFLYIIVSVSYTHVYVQNFKQKKPQYTFNNNFLSLMQETFLTHNMLEAYFMV
jgi:hypothetical protein